MELKNYIYLGIIFIALFGIVGSLVMNSAVRYDKQVDDNMSLMLTGQNYSEFVEIQSLTTDNSITASESAEYQVGSQVDIFSKQTLNQMQTIISNAGTYIEIDMAVISLIIALLIAAVTMGGIYFLRNR